MKKIIKPNKENIIEVGKVLDSSMVGLLLGKEKFLVGSKRESDHMRFARMNDNFFMVNESYNSIQILLHQVQYSEAFLFDNKMEAINWLLE